MAADGRDWSVTCKARAIGGVAIGGSKLVRAFWGKVFQPVPPPPPYSVLSLGVGSWMPQGAVGKTVVAFASLVFAALL